MDIIDEPIENPILTAMLEKLNGIDENNSDLINEKMNEIAKEVATNAKFLSVVEIDEEDVDDEEVGVSFVHFKTEDDRIFFPIFTDWENLKKGDMYRDTFVKTVVMTFDEYYSLVDETKAGLVINPFSHNLLFGYENICQMKKMKDFEQTGRHEEVISKGTDVLLGEPKVYPTEMVNAVCYYAKDVKDIKAVWLRLMVTGNEQSYLLVVDCAGDIQRNFDGIGHVCQPYLPQGMYLNMIPFSDSFGQQAATVEPFYKRKSSILDLFTR